MLLNFLIACVAIQTLALVFIAFNSTRIARDFKRTADAFTDFLDKFSVMNVGMLPEGIDDFLQDMTSRLNDDDDETKQ